MYKTHIVFFILVSILLVLLLKNRSVMTQRPHVETYTDTSLQLWPYQCIDTMKTSRDNARNWAKDPNLNTKIEKEMSAVVRMGANCVAIDTPYDAEFDGYLNAWISEARSHHLKIWFRGNFSQWEHWFDYGGELSESDLLNKSQTFIASHASYFQDGDIFTIAPEGENGGPFDQVEVNEYDRFRKFLVNEYHTCTTAFQKIKKNVNCSWLSMNGGFARRMLNADTIAKIGGLVTLDHYIKTPEEMGEYIQYFNNQFHSKVVIGEFGAPIPEINGKMDDKTQASFINSLLSQTYIQKDVVSGLCYWTLYDGSTALLNLDYSLKPASDVLKNYYQPGKISGIITDKLGTPLKDITVTTDYGYKAKTDSEGKYELLVPAGDTKLLVQSAEYGSLAEELHIDHFGVYTIDKYLSPTTPGLYYKLRLWLMRVI